MKNKLQHIFYLSIITGLLFFFSIGATAKTIPKSNIYWFCSQPGTIQKQKTLMITDVHQHHDDRDYLEEQKAFIRDVNKPQNWNPKYEPDCSNNHNYDHLKHIFNKTIKRAKSQNFDVVIVSIKKKD